MRKSDCIRHVQTAYSRVPHADTLEGAQAGRRRFYVSRFAQLRAARFPGTISNRKRDRRDSCHDRPEAHDKKRRGHFVNAVEPCKPLNHRGLH